MKVLELFFGLFEWLDVLTPSYSESKEEHIKKIKSYSKLTYVARLAFEITVLLIAYTLILLWLLQFAFSRAILVWMIFALTWLLLIGLGQVYCWASIRFVSDNKSYHIKRYVRAINVTGFVLISVSFAHIYYLD